MGRTRQLGLRRHKATGTHYITRTNGQFKYFSKDPATAERQYAAWIDEKYNAPPGLSQAQPVPAPAALETVRDVFNAYLKFIRANRSPKYFEDMKVPLQEFCDTAAPATTKLTDLKKEHFTLWRAGIHQRVQAGIVSAFWAGHARLAPRAQIRRVCTLVIAASVVALGSATAVRKAPGDWSMIPLQPPSPGFGFRFSG